MDLRAIINNLSSIGFFSVVLPFLLIYVIVFSILEKSNIFSGGNSEIKNVKSTNAIIAFIFALFVVASLQTVTLIQSLITQIGIFIVFILVILLLLGFLFGESYKEIFVKDGKLTSSSKVFSGIIFLIVLIILLNLLGVLTWIYNFFSGFSVNGIISNSTFSTAFVLILIAVIIYFVSKGEDKTPKEDNK